MGARQEASKSPKVRKNSRGETLRADGWREFSELESFVSVRVGNDILRKLAITAFNYSYFEAPYLKINYSDKKFVMLNEFYRRKAMREFEITLLKIDQREGHAKTPIMFDIPSEEKIKEELKNKYAKKKNSLGQDLRPDGWRKFSYPEEFLYMTAGEEILLKICNTAHVYSCIQAEVIGVPVSSPEFVIMNEANRRKATESFVELLQRMTSGGKIKDIQYNPPSESEMRQNINIQMSQTKVIL
jgi:hypothetical protein